MLSRALRRAKYRAWLLAVVLAAVTVGAAPGQGPRRRGGGARRSRCSCCCSPGARHFTARPDPRSCAGSWRSLVLGPLIATALGWAWLALDADGQAPGTTTAARIGQAFLGLVGINGPVRFVDRGGRRPCGCRAGRARGRACWSSLILVALLPADGPHPLDAAEQARVRALLDRWGGDRLAVLLRAARRPVGDVLDERQVGGLLPGRRHRVAGRRRPARRPRGLAGRDRGLAGRGPRRSAGCRRCSAPASGAPRPSTGPGWTPSSSATRRSSTPAEFSLEGRSMRVVRQAVSRCARAGLIVTCHRVADLDDATLGRAARAGRRSGATARSSAASRWRWAASATRATTASVVVLCRDAGRDAARAAPLRAVGRRRAVARPDAARPGHRERPRSSTWSSALIEQ